MEPSYLITAALCGIVAYCLYLLAISNKNYWKKRGIVSVYSPPLFGVMLDVFLQRRSISQIFKDIYKQLDGERFGGYFQFGSPVLMVRDPELINQILIKDFIYFENRGPEWKRKTDLFSLGISNLTGDEWRAARHKLTPTFTSGKLKMMFDPITQCSEVAVSHITNNLDQDVDAKDLSLKFIINVIGRVGFGLSIDTFKDDKVHQFMIASSNFFRPSAITMIKLMIAMTNPNLRDYYDFKLLDDDVDSFFRKLAVDIVKYRESTGTRRNDFLQLMIDERKREKEQLLKGHTTSVQSVEVEDPDDKELLEQLKNTPVSGKHGKNSTELFTDEFIASQAFLFISGGSETTATVLSFVLYELAVNKEYQRRVQQEVEDVLSTSEFNYQAIKRMNYMEQFIYETTRIHPIGAGLARLSTKDYKIPGSNAYIDKGTYVVIPVSALHNDPQYFVDPDIFNPDRFEDMNAISKGTFFNFGDGPRICIAKRLAMLEMKMYLAKLLLNFDVVLSKKTKLPLTPSKNAFILNVEGGIWVKFQKRQK